MSKVLDRRSYKPGDVIMHEGELATGAFLIQQGKVEVYTSVGNERFHLAYAGKEEVVGEMGLINDAPRSASVVAVEPTICVHVDRPTFEGKIRDADPFVRALMRILSSRLRRLLTTLQSGGRV
ncbi:MAG: cyclic nucleotide-binding domain-containing protein [Alphaproteobacteria bacterium]|nr:cyclic nucleotide-binding domain-containing protein [Alphaproteobacteria bacterium]